MTYILISIAGIGGIIASDRDSLCLVPLFCVNPWTLDCKNWPQN